jgi:hypothetical protein
MPKNPSFQLQQASAVLEQVPVESADLTLIGARGRESAMVTLASLMGAAILMSSPIAADTVLFSTGDPDGKMATASRPDSPGSAEIESADDFILGQRTSVSQATFTGLLPSGVPLSSVQDVVVEIYRVFPNDSNNPPDGRVPTRVNSPSDVAFNSRDSSATSLTFTSSLLSSSFTANNSVLNGINPAPNQTTHGEGPVTGQEVKFTVNFTTPFDLPPDHYFFIPQVKLSNGDFFWLSAPKPIVSGTGPFTPDLQSWIRNDNLDPDWLRVGADIVGGTPAPAFNAAFSLTGTVPEATSSAGLLSLALFSLGCLRWSLRKAQA